MTPHDRDEQRRWLHEILINGVNLTGWEERFITTISEKLVLNGRELSDAEHEKLEQIYAERTP